MRILLIEPPFYSFMEYDRWWYPFALVQLAAIANKAGHEVRVYDGDKYFYKDNATKKRAVLVKKHFLYHDNVENLDYFIWKHFREELINFNPEVVGISVFTCKLKAVWSIIKIVKEYNPAIKICVGGAHVTAVPESFFENNDIDGVFSGYADITFPQWLAAGCPKGKVAGNLDEVDLTILPHGRREALMHPEFYTPKDMGMIATSRGCISHCTFCSGFICGNKIKFKTKELVRYELAEIIDKWKVTSTIVTDSSCTDFPVYFKSIADVYKEFDISWETEGRWVTITKELMEYFLSRGCKYFHVGLESGSNKILKSTRKGCTKELILNKSKILNSIGIKWKLCCMAGFPDETLDDMQETLDFALQINPHNISLNNFCPLPGTELYKEILGITPELSAEVSQLYPSHCFSRYYGIDDYQKMFFKMLEVFDIHNKRSGYGE